MRQLGRFGGRSDRWRPQRPHSRTAGSGVLKIGEESTVHVLTKIFIVLVSLLAVMLVPLVVVYSHNENSYKARFQDAEMAAAAANEALRAAQASAGAEQARLMEQVAELRNVNTALQNENAAAQVTIRQLEMQRLAAEGMQSEISGRLSMLTRSVEAGQQLTESLVGEVRQLRADAVRIEKEKIELDEALKEVTTQLEVAEQARRALAEELARLKDEHSKVLTQLSLAFQQGFTGRDDVRVGSLIPDKTLTATIIRVDRSTSQVLAEIDSGSRDGVKEGWEMTINNGGDFIGVLRIIDVDINRATGVVSLEDPVNRGRVTAGQTAHAYAGQQ